MASVTLCCITTTFYFQNSPSQMKALSPLNGPPKLLPRPPWREPLRASHEWSRHVCPSETGALHWAVSLGPSMPQQVSDGPPFRLNSISCVHLLCVSVHLLVCTWVDFSFWPLWIMLLRKSLSPCFRCVLSSGIAGCRHNSVLDWLRSLHTVCRSSTGLHSPCRAPGLQCLHIHPHLRLSGFSCG